MQLRIERRFRGPARSGNGGYVAGLLADRLLEALPVDPGSVAVSVRLRRPPPLEEDLEVELRAPGAVLLDGTNEIATASRSGLEREPVEAVPYDAAAATSASYVSASDHPFPGCFVCGPDRAPGDGLRLLPGRFAPGRTAAVWEPDESIADDRGAVSRALVWAALDCPGGWTSELTRRPMVLGTMTAQVELKPRVGERCVVTGRLDKIDERRAWTSTALYGPQGDLLARAEAIWVRVDPEAFNQLFPEDAARP